MTDKWGLPLDTEKQFATPELNLNPVYGLTLSCFNYYIWVYYRVVYSAYTIHLSQTQHRVKDTQSRIPIVDPSKS
jgi:hypothetical protein